VLQDVMVFFFFEILVVLLIFLDFVICTEKSSCRNYTKLYC